MCRLLLATNILLDALNARRPESAEARKLIDRCNGWGEEGLVCALSLKYVYCVSARMRGEAWARNAVRMLVGLLVGASVDAEVCSRTLDSNEPDFKDGIVRTCAELNGADFIITRDRFAFANSTVRGMTATEYLSMAKANDREYDWTAGCG